MSAQVIPFAPRPQTPPAGLIRADEPGADLLDEGIGICQEMIAFLGREIERLSPPQAADPPTEPAPAGVKLYIQLQRLSSGPKRSFWVSPHGTAYYDWAPKHRLYLPVEEWDADVMKAIAEDIAPQLPGDGDGAHVWEVHRSRSYEQGNNWIAPVLRNGRWRAHFGSTHSSRLPARVRELLLSLPLTEDSWTPADAAVEAEAEARNRDINAKLLKVRHALAARPDVWPAIAGVIWGIDEQKGGA